MYLIQIKSGNKIDTQKAILVKWLLNINQKIEVDF
jgi:hypothetical protein